MFACSQIELQYVTQVHTLERRRSKAARRTHTTILKSPAGPYGEVVPFETFPLHAKIPNSITCSTNGTLRRSLFRSKNLLHRPIELNKSIQPLVCVPPCSPSTPDLRAPSLFLALALSLAHPENAMFPPDHHRASRLTPSAHFLGFRGLKSNSSNSSSVWAFPRFTVLPAVIIVAGAASRGVPSPRGRAPRGAGSARRYLLLPALLDLPLALALLLCLRIHLGPLEIPSPDESIPMQPSPSITLNSSKHHSHNTKAHAQDQRLYPT